MVRSALRFLYFSREVEVMVAGGKGELDEGEVEVSESRCVQVLCLSFFLFSHCASVDSCLRIRMSPTYVCISCNDVYLLICTPVPR